MPNPSMSSSKKILEGEISFRFLRTLLPYLEWLPQSLIEAAVLDGAIDKEALAMMREAAQIIYERDKRKETI